MNVHGVTTGTSFSGTWNYANPKQRIQPFGYEGKYFAGHASGDSVHFGAKKRDPILTQFFAFPVSPNAWFRKSPEQKFIRAIQKNDRHGVEEYLKNGGNIDYQDGGGYTGLMHALSSSHADLAKFLLEKGADKNLHDKNGQTALHDVVSSFNYFSPRTRRELAELIATPQNINRKDYYTEHTALYSSIKNGFDDTSLKLIELGADARIPAKDKLTTLMQSAWNDQAEVADALIRSVPEKDEREAFVNAKNKWGRTAADMARTFKKGNVLRILFMHAARDYKDESTLAAEKAEREAAEAAALAAEEAAANGENTTPESDAPPAEEA